MGIPLSRREQFILLDRVRVEIVGDTVLGTTIIPFDSTIPQITEGEEIFNFNYTPKKVGSIIRLSSVILIECSVASNFYYGLWLDSAVNAVRGQFEDYSTASQRGVQLNLDHEIDVASLSPINFQLRSSGNGAGTYTLNRASGTVTFGGTLASWIVIEEFAPPGAFD